MKSLACCSLVLAWILMTNGASANTIRIDGGHKRTSHHIGQRYSKPTNKSNMIPNLDPSTDVPYFVRLDGSCNGSLISSRVILTASAQCMEAAWYPQNQVVVDPKGKKLARTVIASESHPDFDDATTSNNQYHYQLYLLDEPVDSVTFVIRDKDDWPSEAVKTSAMSWIQQVVCQDWGVDAADFCD